MLPCPPAQALQQQRVVPALVPASPPALLGSDPALSEWEVGLRSTDGVWL